MPVVVFCFSVFALFLILFLISSVRRSHRKQAYRNAIAEQERRNREERRRREMERKRIQEEKARREEVQRREKAEQVERLIREREENRPFVERQRSLMKPSLRYEILSRDRFRCQICGATQADGVRLHVDHIVPVSKGGKTERSNLRTLCERCNIGKGATIEEPGK